VDYSSLSCDQLVAACCQPANEPAWAEFIKRFQPLIAKVVLRTARRWNASSSPLLDDLVQDTYVKLCANDCKLLREFESRSQESFYAYLKVVACNVVHDHFKSSLAAKRGFGIELNSLDVGSKEGSAAGNAPIRSPMDQAERQVLMREIDQQLIQSLSPKDASRGRTVFWLYYRAGMTANAIASLSYIDLTTKGVESLLYRMTQQVKSTIGRKAGVEKRSDEACPDRKGI
jgi:RNA polymerase sigma-70 factor (ECF subfamily)